MVPDRRRYPRHCTFPPSRVHASAVPATCFTMYHVHNRPFLQLLLRFTYLTMDKRIASQRGKRMYVGTKAFCKETMSAYTAVFSTVTSPRSSVPVNLVKSSGCLYGRAREGTRYIAGQLAWPMLFADQGQRYSILTADQAPALPWHARFPRLKVVKPLRNKRHNADTTGQLSLVRVRSESSRIRLEHR